MLPAYTRFPVDCSAPSIKGKRDGLFGIHVGRARIAEFWLVPSNCLVERGRLHIEEFTRLRLFQQSKIPHAAALPARHDQMIEQRDA
jgi:hypothetical protein